MSYLVERAAELGLAKRTLREVIEETFDAPTQERWYFISIVCAQTRLLPNSEGVNDFLIDLDAIAQVERASLG